MAEDVGKKLRVESTPGTRMREDLLTWFNFRYLGKSSDLLKRKKRVKRGTNKAGIFIVKII